MRATGKKKKFMLEYFESSPSYISFKPLARLPSRCALLDGHLPEYPRSAELGIIFPYVWIFKSLSLILLDESLLPGDEIGHSRNSDEPDNYSKDQGIIHFITSVK